MQSTPNAADMGEAVLASFRHTFQQYKTLADRALAQRVSPDQWQAVISRLSTALAARHVEDGLTRALEETSALLAQHFGMAAAPGAPRSNELSDAPHLQ